MSMPDITVNKNGVKKHKGGLKFSMRKRKVKQRIKILNKNIKYKKH